MLLDSIKRDDLTLANRVTTAPTTRSRDDIAGLVGDLQTTYSPQRATAGQIITEGINISPSIPVNTRADSDPVDLFSHLITRLDAMPLAYLHLMEPLFPLDDFPDFSKDPLTTFGPLYHGTLMTNGGYSQTSAEAVLQSGRAQMVSFGAKYVANPDLVARFAKGAALAEPDRATMYGGGAKGLIDYPAMAG
jgi:N-ethylmaleimide reductase